MTLLTIFIALILIGVVYWGTMRLLGAFGIGDPIATVVQVVLVILILLWLLGQFAGVGPTLRLR